VSSLRQKAVSGLKWAAFAQFSRLGTQLLAVIVLARLLPPADFGLVAMATVVTGFANLFRDMGSAAAIIQRRDPNPQLLDSLFWLNLVFGFGTALLLWLIAPLVALGFSEPRLKEVLWLLLLIFPLTSIGVVHQALLERASHFRPLAIIESSAAIIGLFGAVLAAQAGWGAFSLVLQNLLAVLITSTGVWLVSKWRPHFNWNTSEILGVLGFGGNLVGFNVFNYLIRNMDNLLIGRFLGSTDLGYYSTAYRLMLWPLQNISSVVGRALFPVFSRLQVDRGRLASAYIRATAATTLITAPMMFGFFVLREPFVMVALGERWLPMAEVLAWLVPVGLLQSVGTTVGSLYLATGRTDVMFKWGVGAGLLVIPAFAIGLHWGITGVAAAYFFVSLLLFLPGLAIPFRLVDLQLSTVLWKLVPALATAFFMALLLFALNAAWPVDTDRVGQTVRLVLLTVIGILTYGCLSLLTQRTLLRDLARLAVNR
jgi:O-antigen/teichoic acid export membrane protein